MREWLVVIGGIMIVGVLAHGAWVFVRNRREALGIRYEDNIPDIDVDDIDLLRGELPSGGARVVTSSAAKAELESQQAALEDAGDAPAAAGVELDQPVPVLLDPIDRDVARAAEAGSEAQADVDAPIEPAQAAPADDRPAAHVPGVDDGVPEELARTDDFADVEPPPIEQDDSAAERAPASDSSLSSVDAATKSPTDILEETAPSADFEQAPLFAGEPIVERAEHRESGRRRRRARAQEKAPPQSEPAVPEPLGPPEEVIVINVLCRGDERADGPTLVEAITEHGLRFGDMNIFHRTSPGDRMRTDFSLASAVEPGTFDLGAMDGFTTRGVTLFMQLPGPADPIEAFEDMVRIARGIASRIGGDLKDEQHSVMTGQTIEHCRQRVREFTRRQMSRRV